MRIVSLTDKSIREVFNSVVSTDEAAHAVTKVIANTGGNYVNFLYAVLNTHSSYYVKATSPDSSLSTTDLLKIITTLRTVDPTIDVSQILVADKMDILYGNDYRSFTEYSKFNGPFYEHVYDVVTGGGPSSGEPQIELMFEDVIRIIEYAVSVLEQHIVFNGVDCGGDDTAIICLVPRNGVIFFIIL